MDLLFLPKTVEKHPGFVTRTTYRSFVHTETTVRQYGGFYYIGKNASHIEKLVSVYKSGYASEGLENVKMELLRSLQQEGNLLPEVILCEARFDYSSIRQFHQFLRKHPILSAIPFILDASGLNERELDLYKANTRPDEIIFLQNLDDKSLKLKIQFLRKVKSAVAGAPARHIEQNIVVKKFSLGPLSKRAFDVLISSIALLLLSPIFLLIAVAICIESRGPIFYIAQRAGRGYRIFNFYKFRTMHQDADKRIAELTHLNQYNADNTGPVFFKINNDPRITRIGSFLRNTSLDELPQLFNVFLGHMSLVGNRPLPLYEAAALTTDDYAARFMAPAGITGLWQVKKRGNKDMSVEERINMDIAYATKCNFATDLWIIANTPSALLQKENV
ncbi:MAG TPA: sugar transferase [Puia sp.]|jgi:lipopolysaccharide/colanic/teichoic acid biosynthesis glycosyltransferase